MLKIFKRNRPQHRAESKQSPSISIEDLLVARWFGLTPEQWGDMPAIAKVDKRESYAQAWGFGA
jgi:hypothetical protein